MAEVALDFLFDSHKLMNCGVAFFEGFLSVKLPEIWSYNSVCLGKI